MLSIADPNDSEKLVFSAFQRFLLSTLSTADISLPADAEKCANISENDTSTSPYQVLSNLSHSHHC